jgi:acid phosphatase
VQDHDAAPDADDLPDNPARRRIFQAAAAVGLSASLPAVADAAPGHAKAVAASLDAKLKAHVKNVVVIFLENRSFNNLFANFPGTAAPLSDASPAPQKDRDGSVLPTLPKVWGGMVPGRQDIGGKDYLI